MIFDFSGDTDTGATTITVIFDDGVMGDADSQPNDWTFYVDDIELYTTLTSVFDYSQDFEGLVSADDTINGWELGLIGGELFKVFANVFDGETYLYGYGPFTAPNGGGGFSAIAAGEGGVDQGAQYMNIYSDYDNTDHGNGFNIVSSVFKEGTMAAETTDTVIYTFSFDAKAPDTCGIAAAVNCKDGEVNDATASAFIKTLDPNNGYATTNIITVDMTDVDNTDWKHFSISIELDSAALTGQILQFGWETTATDYDDSGVYYDNLNFIVLEPAP